MTIDLDEMASPDASAATRPASDATHDETTTSSGQDDAPSTAIEGNATKVTTILESSLDDLAVGVAQDDTNMEESSSSKSAEAEAPKGAVASVDEGDSIKTHGNEVKNVCAADEKPSECKEAATPNDDVGREEPIAETLNAADDEVATPSNNDNGIPMNSVASLENHAEKSDSEDSRTEAPRRRQQGDASAMNATLSGANEGKPNDALAKTAEASEDPVNEKDNNRQESDVVKTKEESCERGDANSAAQSDDDSEGFVVSMEDSKKKESETDMSRTHSNGSDYSVPVSPWADLRNMLIAVKRGGSKENRVNPSAKAQSSASNTDKSTKPEESKQDNDIKDESSSKSVVSDDENYDVQFSSDQEKSGSREDDDDDDKSIFSGR